MMGLLAGLASLVKSTEEAFAAEAVVAAAAAAAAFEDSQIHCLQPDNCLEGSVRAFFSDIYRCTLLLGMISSF